MKRLSEYIHFVKSHHEAQDKCRVLWQNLVNPPPRPPKIYRRATLPPTPLQCWLHYLISESMYINIYTFMHIHIHMYILYIYIE